MNLTTSQLKRQYTYEIQDRAGEILGAEWPVSHCLKRPASAGGVRLLFDGQRSRYDVITCKSAWTCPVCGKRIMAGRRAEIENILLKAAVKGWRSLFLTVTLSHHVNSRLDELLKALVAAWRSVFSGDRTGKRRVFLRVKAQIKTLEIRFGLNGYHPHLHVLLLVDEAGLSETEAGLFEDELSEALFSRYARKVESMGMRVDREAYSWRPVSGTSAASAYVTKLEMALEMTSPETKEGEAARKPSFTMFQLLAKYERGERKVYGRDIADIFQEFAEATKGKRQVSYSREIKALLEIDEKPDEELAAEEEKPEERELAVIPLVLWRVVCERRLRAALLDIGDSGDESRVRVWLDALLRSTLEAERVRDEVIEQV